MRISQQKGLSLIELMIAISLGVVMMGAALQFLYGTTKTYKLNDDISRVQENGRIALDLMADNIDGAGNGPAHQPSKNASFQTDCTDVDSCVQDNSQLAGSSSDQLAMLQEPYPDDGTQTDCTGAAVPANIGKYANIYSIQDLDGDGVNSLYCGSYDVNNHKWLSKPQPLVDGIDQMQVLYKYTTPADSTSLTDNDKYRYISSDQIASDDYGNVRAVKIALLVSNGQTTGSAENKKRTYVVLDGPQTSFTDTELRRIYSTTVYLRNVSD